MTGAGFGKHPDRATGFQNCPVLGVGLGLRRSLFEEILKHHEDEFEEGRSHKAEPGMKINWLEFTPENYMRRGGRSRAMLAAASTRYPMVSHGVSMSIGSTDDWNEDYLRDLETLFEIANPPWFSDHLCFSSVGGRYFNDLIPLPRTREAVEHVASRVKYLQDRFQRPVLIENISQYVQYPDDEWREAEFLGAILEKADCGLLLDVNNLYVNSKNSSDSSGDGDPKALMAALPLERVVQIHVAGHHRRGEHVIDTHGAPVIDPVWDLLGWVLSQPACRPCGVMLERDNEIPPLSELMPELQKIHAIWAGAEQKPEDAHAVPS